MSQIDYFLLALKIGLAWFALFVAMNDGWRIIISLAPSAERVIYTNDPIPAPWKPTEAMTTSTTTTSILVPTAGSQMTMRYNWVYCDGHPIVFNQPVDGFVCAEGRPIEQKGIKNEPN